MKKVICDICQQREASTVYMVRRSTKRPFPMSNWSQWREIDVCEKCGDALFNLTEPKAPPKR